VLIVHIEPNIKLDFSDVLIKPKRSTLQSRKDVDLVRNFTYKNSRKTFSGIPLIAENMDTVGTLAMADEFKKANMITALHKHIPTKDIIEFLDKNPDHIDLFFVSIGMSEKELVRFEEIFKHHPTVSICVDVANGYTEQFVSFISRVRSRFPSTTIMAGNVVTSEMTEQLILSGADIVKVGIGSGCLTGDARILMSDGTYKNIVDVKAGDHIITMTGESAAVKRQWCTGHKKVQTIRHGHFHTPLALTSNHECFVGDLNSVSQSTIWGRGYKRILETTTRFGESKIKWKPVSELQKDAAMLPNNIKWDLPENFEYDISEYFKNKKYLNQYNTKIQSTYNLGYLFGYFMGDGNSTIPLSVNKKRNTKSFTGRCQWYINSKDVDDIEKLSNVIYNVIGKECVVKDSNSKLLTTLTLYSKQWAHLFDSFGKLQKKHLPKKYLCTNKEYVQGLHDGLVDSDGHTTAEGQINFCNTSKQLIELFGWVTFHLTGSYPNVLNNGKRCSYLVKNPRWDGYRSFLAISHKKRQLENYQIIKILDTTNESDSMVPVYDLEIDHCSHSFIANNMIVHNSVRTTRKQTGVGYPQLSAIIECADSAHGLGGLICADGGCTIPGDVAKAFGGGADFVMLGGMLAGHDECGGEIRGGGATLKYITNMPKPEAIDQNAVGFVIRHDGTEDGPIVTTIQENVCNTMRQLYHMQQKLEETYSLQHPLVRKYPELFDIDRTNTRMQFYGMSSSTAMNKHNGGVANYRSSEGKTVMIQYKGPVKNTILDILGGLRSACTYIGSKTLKEISKRTTFIKVNNTHNKVFVNNIS